MNLVVFGKCEIDIDIAEDTSQIIQGLSSAFMTDSDNLNTTMDSLIDDIRKFLYRKYKSEVEL